MKSILSGGRAIFGRNRDSAGPSNEEADSFQFFDLEGEGDGEFGQQQRNETKVDSDAPRHFGCDDFDEDDMKLAPPPQR